MVIIICDILLNVFEITYGFFLPDIVTRDRNRIELSNNSVRFGSTQPNRTEPNPNFGKVGRIESNRMQNESNRTECK